MDAATAARVAVNIAQLLELSWKLVSKTRTIREQGHLPETRDAQTVTEDLGISNLWLADYLDEISSIEDDKADDEPLRYLCVCMSEVSEELLKHLERIASSGRRYKSTRQALKAYYTKEQLASLSARFQEYRTQLNTRLLLSLKSQHLADLDKATHEITELLEKHAPTSDSKLPNQTWDLKQVIVTYSTQIQSSLRDTNNVLTNPAVPVRRSADPSNFYEAIVRRDTKFLDAAIATHSNLLKDPCEGGGTLLHFAVRQGNVEMVRYLLMKGAEPRVRDSVGMTALECLGTGSLIYWFLQYGPSLETCNGQSLTALGHFSREGDLKAIRMLLDMGAEVDAPGQNERTPLMEAASNGKALVIETLLHYGADVNHIKRRKETALLLAASHGYTTVSEILLRAGANVNAQDASDCTSLAICCRHDFLDMAHLLLRHGADPNIASCQGYEPLLTTAQKGHVRLLTALLNSGADVNQRNVCTGKTALSEACEAGHTSTIELLLSCGCNPNTHTYYKGWTPLMFAAIKGMTANISLLLELGGAESKATDFENRTALYHAVVHKHTHAVAVLIKAGADVEIAGFDAEYPHISYTPLCRACWYQDRPEALARSLIAAGADVNAINAEGVSALMEASKWGNLGIVQSLMEAGADVNYVQQRAQETALLEACSQGFHDVAAFLLEHGANPNARNKDRMMSIHRATQNNHVRLVQLLAATAGAEINGKDRNGKTPLLEAADRGHLEVCEILLANRADADCRDSSNYTPLCRAAWRDHAKIVRMLVDTGDADVDAQNTGLMTPLAEACKHGHAEIVQALLERGANRELVDDRHVSPMQHAKRSGHPKSQQIIWMLKEYFPVS